MQHPVPLAIIAAGIVIAGAVFLVQKQPVVAKLPIQTAPDVRVPGIMPGDHVRGNPNAPVVIIEYSDTECPFCKQFHSTLKQIIDSYGKTGKVAWVFRNFPVVESHPKAMREALSLECAADVGGEQAFWKYVDKIYEVTPSNDGLDATQLNVIANDIGLDVTKFATCVESGKFKSKIEKTVAEAKAAGATGTPFSIFMYGQDEYTVQGYQTYGYLQGLLDILVTSSDSGTTSASTL